MAEPIDRLGGPQRLSGWRDLPQAVRGAGLALGNFDGVHRGHAEVIRALHSARPNAPVGVVTFEPHPREFFRPDDPPFRLTLAEERAEALGTLGVSFVVELPFDVAFSNLTAETFVEEILHGALAAKHLACGPDFAFGHRRGGDVTFLAEQAEARGIGLSVVPKLSDDEGPISSTRIRRALQDGYPARATALLGRPWTISGAVERGDELGRKIGFPTANLRLGRHLEPARGVYAVTGGAEEGAIFRGVANVGRRPTVSASAESRVEVHLFDFNGNLYGKTLRVSIHEFLRAERKFGSIDALKAQIAQDAQEARQILGLRLSRNCIS